MVRNVRKMSAEAKKKLAENTSAANREKDTVYWLVFVPSDALINPTNEQAEAWNAQFRVELLGNPKKNPQFIEKAILRFETERGVKSWKELAVSYRVEELYCG